VDEVEGAGLKAFEGYDSRLAAWQGLALAFLGIALQPLLLPSETGPIEASALQEAEQFFFEPHQGSPALILGVMGFLAWRRHGVFMALATRPSPIAAALATAIAAGFVIWSQLNEAPDQRMLALLAGGVAFCLALRGFAGVRLMAVALVPALFALPIPGRLSNEIVWFLQLASASGAELLLNTFGVGVLRDGVYIDRAGLGFLIIESCSGFRMVHTLSLLSIVIGDLLSLGRRGVLLFLVAPLVAFALNVLRVVWIVLGEEGTAEASQHVGQGMTVLIAGMALLFGLGLKLEDASKAVEASGATVEPDAAASGASAVPIWRRLAVVLAVFAVGAHVVPAWPRSTRVASVPLPEFEDRPRWTVEEIGADRMFLGALGIGRIVQRRFEHEGSRQAIGGPVELFVGIESANHPRRSPFSPLLLLPNRHFGLERLESGQDFRLGETYQEAITRRGNHHFLVRVWNLNDPGFATEVARSFFALERGPFESSDVRVALQIATPIPKGGPETLKAATALLDLFVIAYREEIEALVR
jgi:exosortase